MTTDHRGDASEASRAGEVRVTLNTTGRPVVESMNTVVDRRAGGTTIVQVFGEIDMLTAPGLRECVDEEVDHGCAALVLDLRHVAFLGSSGLAALVGALHRCEAAGAKLRLVVDTRVVSRPLEASGLLEVFDVSAEVQSAAV
jgi:anti-sigma B factor antagonist